MRKLGLKRGNFVFSSATMSDTIPREQAFILSLWNHAGLSQTEIARRSDVNQSTVSWVIKQVVKTGPATPKKKRKTSQKDNIFVTRQNKLDPEKPASICREI